LNATPFDGLGLDRKIVLDVHYQSLRNIFGCRELLFREALRILLTSHAKPIGNDRTASLIRSPQGSSSLTGALDPSVLLALRESLPSRLSDTRDDHPGRLSRPEDYSDEAHCPSGSDGGSSAGGSLISPSPMQPMHSPPGPPLSPLFSPSKRKDLHPRAFQKLAREDREEVQDALGVSKASEDDDEEMPLVIEGRERDSSGLCPVLPDPFDLDSEMVDVCPSSSSSSSSSSSRLPAPGQEQNSRKRSSTTQEGVALTSATSRSPDQPLESSAAKVPRRGAHPPAAQEPDLEKETHSDRKGKEKKDKEKDKKVNGLRDGEVEPVGGGGARGRGSGFGFRGHESDERLERTADVQMENADRSGKTSMSFAGAGTNAISPSDAVSVSRFANGSAAPKRPARHLSGVESRHDRPSHTSPVPADDRLNSSGKTSPEPSASFEAVAPSPSRHGIAAGRDDASSSGTQKRKRETAPPSHPGPSADRTSSVSVPGPSFSLLSSPKIIADQRESPFFLIDQRESPLALDVPPSAPIFFAPQPSPPPPSGGQKGETEKEKEPKKGAGSEQGEEKPKLKRGRSLLSFAAIRQVKGGLNSSSNSVSSSVAGSAAEKQAQSAVPSSSSGLPGPPPGLASRPSSFHSLPSSADLPIPFSSHVRSAPVDSSSVPAEPPLPPPPAAASFRAEDSAASVRQASPNASVHRPSLSPSQSLSEQTLSTNLQKESEKKREQGKEKASQVNFEKEKPKEKDGQESSASVVPLRARAAPKTSQSSQKSTKSSKRLCFRPQVCLQNQQQGQGVPEQRSEKEPEVTSSPTPVPPASTNFDGQKRKEGEQQQGDKSEPRREAGEKKTDVEEKKDVESEKEDQMSTQPPSLPASLFPHLVNNASSPPPTFFPLVFPCLFPHPDSKAGQR